MTSLYCDHNYYKKMLELQEQLRKSEEHRIRLEERFNLMEQESRMRHEACINKLRMRYIEFLEEQRLRDERNHKLIGALDKVDSSLALMSAKTDKLHSLKREYEASLLRAHANQRPGNSVAGDSGVMSQDEDKLTKKETLSKSKITSAPLYNYEGRLKTTESLKSHYKPIGTLKQVPTRALSSSMLFKPPVHSEPSLQNRLATFGDYQRNLEPQYAIEQSPINTWKNDYAIDLDNFYKRDLRKNLIAKESSAFRYLECLKTPQTSKLTDFLSSMPNLKENYVENVNNDLVSYINKIRNLHANHDQSLEEVDHEQNTSGDLLNVTLSDDGLDHLPVEERKEKIVLPEVKRDLALADDLASKIVDKGHTETRSKDFPSKSQENNIPKSFNAVQPINPSALIHSTLFDSNIQPVVLPEEFELMKAKVDDNIATQVIKLDQPIENTVVEQSESTDDAKIYVEIEKEEIYGDKEKVNEQDDKLNNVPTNRLINSKETKEDLQVTPNLQHQSIENLEKQIEQIFINETSNLNNFIEPTIQVTNSLLRAHDSAMDDENDQTKTKSEKVLSEINQNTVNVINEIENTTEEVENLNKTHAENNGELNLETSEPNEKIPQNINQGYEYNQEQYQTEANQDYQYEMPEQYIKNTEDHYQYEQYGEYMNDPNAQYQDPNAQYQDPNSQYQDPNAQYQDPNSQYQDPNAQYQDPNSQYQDPNSQYQDPNSQYHDQQYINNENQQYSGDQPHVQDENQQYLENPNQQYQEYSQDPDQVYQQETYVQDSNQVYNPNDYNYSNQDEAFYQSNAYSSENQVYNEEKNYPENDERVEDVSAEQSDTRVENNTRNQSMIDVGEKDNTLTNDNDSKKQNDDIQTIRESDTDSTMEVNISTTENEFDFN